MNVYCTNKFAVEFGKLKKNKKYADLEQLLIKDFLSGQTIADVNNGDLLNGSTIAPFLKKRVPDAAGYRIYYYVIIKDDDIYLTWLHPKIGPAGIDNIGKEFKKQIQKDVIACIKAKDFLVMKLTPDNEIKFEEYVPKQNVAVQQNKASK